MDSPRLPADRIGSQLCHCAPPGGESPPDLSLRGSAGAVAISQYTPGTQESPGEFDSACLRFPRRFAPRNDKLGSIARSAKPLYNLPACKALNPRKGDAASVRRQSRQRLRSERRYTPYFGVCHFNGGRYGTAVPSRDCHVGLRPPRNDNSGAGAVLAAAGTGCECSAGSGMPLPYNAYTKTPNGRGLRPGHGFYTRREEGWKTCGGILLTFRASA